MKIILSRKGFDSATGGYCSPILPDGTLLSLPIPHHGDGAPRYPVSFSQLHCEVADPTTGGVQVMSYEEILSQLSGGRWVPGQLCHLDPDLRESVLPRRGSWCAAFGQSGEAKKFLDDAGVDVGDIFLFFGRFRQTEFSQGKLQYKRDAPELHIIYGYLQVGEILHGGADIDARFPRHPHAFNGRDNNLYLPAAQLSLNPALPGFGMLGMTQRRVLTKYGAQLSRWLLPRFFRGLDLRANTRADSLLPCFHDADDGQEYFQFIGRGQEFLLDVHRSDEFADYYQCSLEEWAYSIISDNPRDEMLGELYRRRLARDFGEVTGVEAVACSARVLDTLGDVDGQYQAQGIYCRRHHRIAAFASSRCDACPLWLGRAQGMGADCAYDLPVCNGRPLALPTAPRDRFAFYDILIRRGLLPAGGCPRK